MRKFEFERRKGNKLKVRSVLPPQKKACTPDRRPCRPPCRRTEKQCRGQTQGRPAVPSSATNRPRRNAGRTVMTLPFCKEHPRRKGSSACIERNRTYGTSSGKRHSPRKTTNGRRDQRAHEKNGPTPSELPDTADGHNPALPDRYRQPPTAELPPTFSACRTATPEPQERPLVFRDGRSGYSM